MPNKMRNSSKQKIISRTLSLLLSLLLCFSSSVLALLCPSNSKSKSRCVSTHNNNIPRQTSHVPLFLSSNINSDAENNRDGIGIGIDLGTTHSAVAFIHPDTQVPTIIPIPNNGRTMPSVVTIQNDQVLVGKEAIEKEAQQGSYRNVKRILGRGMLAARDSVDVVPFLTTTGKQQSQSSSSSSAAKKTKWKNKQTLTLTKQMKEAQENPAVLYAPGKQGTILPTEISAHIVQKLVQSAEDYTGQKVSRAVIGIPAYFHDVQREATIQAANMAGIDKVKLLREPEAAALAYGIGKQQLSSLLNDNNDEREDEEDDDDELVLVFDLGGGTYDVSMLLVGGGLTEILTTSGDSQLGGSDFDARVAQYLRKLLAAHGLTVSSNSKKTQLDTDDDTCSAADAIVRSAEMIRIYLSNNRRVNLALPLSEDAWSHMPRASDVILPLHFTLDEQPLADEGWSNSTHVLCQLTRRNMEKMCSAEFLALLRPLREVAIMAGALLSGDTSPTAVQAALELEETQDDKYAFDAFYKEGDNEEDEEPSQDEETAALLLALDEMSLKERKRAQQKGRKKARDVTKRERKYRQEKRKVMEQAPIATDSSGDTKIRDGISGRPISRVVLVGGATRMPAIGRLLSVLTGVAPQKTVDPDEAVALGCAVHVGILDGKEGMGTVLNPMQAAILRAVAEQQQRQEGLLSDDFEDDDDDFDSVEYF